MEHTNKVKFNRNIFKSCMRKSTPLFFILPAIALLGLFVLYPFVQTIINSFYDMSYTRNNGYVGFDNYIEIFKNQEYLNSLKVSLYYVVSAVLQVVLALVLAILLYNNKKFMGFFKGCIFIPYLVNAVAIGYMFRLFLTRGFIFDTILGSIGFDTNSLPFWLRDQGTNNIVLATISLWRYTGFNMVIFLGALSAIDNNNYNMASLDGANYFQKLRYITLPSIKKVFFLTLLLSVISSLNEFELPYIIASGGANKTATFMIYIFRTGQISHKVGLASAMSVVLISIILIILILIFIGYIIYSSLRRKRS